MTDLGREIEAAVRVDWNDARSAAARAGLRPRRRRRLVARAALGSLAAIGLVIGWLAWPGEHHAVQPIAARPVVEPSPVMGSRFDDGSTVVRDDSTTVVRTVRSAPGRIVVELARGAGRFDVVDDPTRVFRVESGPVKIEAFGAVFACSQVDQQTQVEVFRGTLRVLWDDQQRELRAGDRGLFPPAAVAPTPTVTPARPSPARTLSPGAVRTDGWRELARDGDFDRAYAVLATGTSEVHDEPEELLLAADVKRLSHHPAEAVAPLRTVVRDHATDPRASLAAFTLGRVLLEELGRPGEAAGAFADAVRLAPDGPMAQDAIAREVEALSRAGESTAAKQLAEQYLQRFPDGRKVKSVRRFGAIE